MPSYTVLLKEYLKKELGNYNHYEIIFGDSKITKERFIPRKEKIYFNYNLDLWCYENTFISLPNELLNAEVITLSVFKTLHHSFSGNQLQNGICFNLYD